MFGLEFAGAIGKNRNYDVGNLDCRGAHSILRFSHEAHARWRHAVGDVPR